MIDGDGLTDVTRSYFAEKSSSPQASPKSRCAYRLFARSADTGVSRCRLVSGRGSGTAGWRSIMAKRPFGVGQYGLHVPQTRCNLTGLLSWPNRSVRDSTYYARKRRDGKPMKPAIRAALGSPLRCVFLSPEFVGKEGN